MPVETRITGGTVVTESGSFEADVAIDDKRIVAVGSPSTLPEAEEVVDADGRLVMPGFVDPHVHIDDSASVDTYESATAAAALGGITTVVDFAWQTEDSDPTNDPRCLLEGINRKREKAADAYVDYGLQEGITVETESVLDETKTITPELLKSGADYSVYDGRDVTGWPTHTIVRGRVVYEDGDVVGDPGFGRHIERPV